MNVWKKAIIRMIEPNPDMAAETCEWIIAIVVSGILLGIGFTAGRLGL